MSLKNIVMLAVSTVFLCIGIIGIAFLRKKESAKKKRMLFKILTIASGWFLGGTILTIIFSAKMELKVEFELFSPRISLFGISFAQTTVISFFIVLITLLLSLIFRFIIFPKFDKDNPKGIQNIIELAVEAMDNFAKGTLLDYSGQLAPYMFSLALFMVLSAFSELFGLRAPTSDIAVTFAMGLLTFILINYFGIKKKGLKGRLSALTKPTPFILPMKILSDIAVPISLACRLFGNMLGGLIVMDLLKSVLGGYAIGIPPVMGLYFNLFHPIIQAYIFILLSMTFINESIE